MKTLFTLACLGLTLVAPLRAQDTLARAQADLEKATELLRERRQETAAEEFPLVEKVEMLDTEVMAKSRELRALLNDEQRLEGKQKALNDELASRRGEFEFTSNTLDGYAKGLVNRLQPAEVQAYQERLESVRNQAAAAGEDLSAEMKARLEAIRIGAERLKNLAGGQLMAGRAVAPSGDIANGNFAIAGPLALFAAQDGSLAGPTTLSVASLGLPQVAGFEGDDASLVTSFVKSGEGSVPLDVTGGKAIEAKKAGKGFSDYIDGGGIVGYAILGLGVIAIAIAGFKFFEIRFLHLPSLKMVNEIIDSLVSFKKDQAAIQADGLPGLSGAMVRAGVENFYEKRRVLEDALLEKLSAIQPRLERLLPFLALVAAAAPMMGLLGTVLGIMKTFDMMAVYGTGNAKNFSAGIGEALITTAMGLVVAIPVLVVHGLLKSLARGRFDQAQGVALALLNGPTELDGSPPPTADSGDQSGSDEEDFDELELNPA